LSPAKEMSLPSRLERVSSRSRAVGEARLLGEGVENGALDNVVFEVDFGLCRERLPRSGLC
jgi:hypothetical protein